MEEDKQKEIRKAAAMLHKQFPILPDTDIKWDKKTLVDLMLGHLVIPQILINGVLFKDIYTDSILEYNYDYIYNIMNDLSDKFDDELEWEDIKDSVLIAAHRLMELGISAGFEAGYRAGKNNLKFED